MTKKLDLLKPGGARGHQLHLLAREINDSQDAIDLLEDQTRKKGHEWECEVRLQGQRLLEVKELVGHGKWLEWLRANCPLTAERKAQMYMRVASNPQRVSDLGHPWSLRGELREQAAAHTANGNGNGNGHRGTNGNGTPAKSWPAFLEGIGKFAKCVAYSVKHPLSLWPPEGRDKLRTTLEPIFKELWPQKFQ